MTVNHSAGGFPQLGEVPRSSGVVPKPPQINVSLPPAIALDECRLGSLEARLCSRRGIGHAFGGEPRQDDASMVAVGSTLIAAVADGLGSAVHSHVGAHYACRAAVVLAAGELRRGATLDTLDAAGFLTRVEQALPRAAERIIGRSYQPDQCRTTLVVALVDATTGRARVLRVGDSEALVLVDGRWHGLFAPQASDVVNNATHCLPGDATHYEDGTVDLGTVDSLVLATDGLAGVLHSSPQTVGRYFAERLASPLDLTAFFQLLGFERRGALDDRTAVAIWRDQP